MEEGEAERDDRANEPNWADGPANEADKADGMDIFGSFILRLGEV